MAPHSSTLAWKIPWTEEPGRLQSMGSLRVRHDWATSLSLFTFTHWRRKWQPTPVFLPGESQGREPGGLLSMGSHRVGHDWSDLAAAAGSELSTWDLVPSPGIKPRPPHWEHRLNHWTTRGVTAQLPFPLNDGLRWHVALAVLQIHRDRNRTATARGEEQKCF